MSITSNKSRAFLIGNRYQFSVMDFCFTLLPCYKVKREMNIAVTYSTGRCKDYLDCLVYFVDEKLTDVALREGVENAGCLQYEIYDYNHSVTVLPFLKYR